MKRALENLRLINWGTEPGSGIARIIMAILRGMTDLDPLILIPSPGQAIGTDVHRWANQRTSHRLLFRSPIFHQPIIV